MSLIDAFLLDPAPFCVWIAYRQDGIKGSGTLNDPWDGSGTGFDEIMASLPADVAVQVHLGPSPRDSSGNPVPFETNGFSLDANGIPATPAWQPRANMTLVGAGIDVTVLKLVPGSTSGYHYFAVGAPTTGPVDNFRLTDLTIDCGLPSSAAVACGAVRVMGSHVRIQRVKCVNWGTRTNGQPAFVVALIIADPDANSPFPNAEDAGIEGCIVVNPSTNNLTSSEVALLHAGGRELSVPQNMAFGQGPFIRNCFVDGATSTGGPAESLFRGISMGACIGGVVEGNQIHNVYVGGPYQAVLATDSIIVRNNVYRNVVTGALWDLGTNNVGVKNLVMEHNSFELAVNWPGTPPASRGIIVADASPTQAVHGTLVFRGNLFRTLDSQTSSSIGVAVDVDGATALMVEDNIVNPEGVHRIQNSRCDAATFFNNQTSGGKLILGWESDGEFNYGELATDVDDAFILAMLEKR